MREIIIIATVEYVDGSVIFKTYRQEGGSIRQFKTRIRRTLAKDSNVAWAGLGNALVINHYGAH